jgi:hypothetical protein
MYALFSLSSLVMRTSTRFMRAKHYSTSLSRSRARIGTNFWGVIGRTHVLKMAPGENRMTGYMGTLRVMARTRVKETRNQA